MTSVSLRLACVLGKSPQRIQQIQPCLTDLVFDDGDGRVGVARAALRVNHFDVGRRAGAKADIRDLEHLGGLRRRVARALQHTLAAADAFVGRADLGRGLAFAALNVTSDCCNAAWRSRRRPFRAPESNKGIETWSDAASWLQA